MQHIKLSITKIIYLVLTMLFSFMLGSVLVISGQPGIIIGVLCAVGVFVYIVWKSAGKTAFLDTNYKYILAGFLLVAGFYQLCKIDELRFIPAFDLDAIYGGAIAWVETGTFADYYDYFDWFPNNLGGLCFLYFIFKIGSVVTKDYFLIAALINEILILLTYLLISLTTRKLWGSRFGVLALMISGCTLPFYYMADAFYTDSLSLLFPVLLFYLYLNISEKQGKALWKLCVAAALAAVGGIFIKSTVLIMVIAISLAFLLRRDWKRLRVWLICFVAAYVVLMSFFQYYMYHVHLDPELARQKNTPVLHWVMMGLEGEGAYNPGDYEFTRSFTEPKERNEALWQEIKGRVSEKGFGGMISLYAKKLYRCFGNGTFGISDFLDDSPQNEPLVQQFILYSGKSYQFYLNFCNLVFYSVLLLSTLGVWMSIRNQTMEDSRILPSALALGGTIIFLMHWETSARYITNYVPVMIILAIGGSRNLTEWIKEKAWDRKLSALISGKEVRIFTAAVSFRIVVYFMSVCIMAIFGNYSEGITFSDFLEAWKRWDSAHYINIAENGYSGAIENGQHLFLVFLPLFPWLMKTLSLLIGDTRLCGILISVVSYGIGSVYFYKITEREMGEAESRYALLLISVFPFAFFYGSIATESLFFAVTSLFFYYLRKHDWFMVAFLGALACLTKLQGLLLAFAVLVELFYFKRGIRLLRNGKWKSFFKRIIYPGCISAFMLTGFGIYLLVNYYVEGDPFRFMYYQRNHWTHTVCPIWQAFDYIKDNAIREWYTSTGMSLWMPQFVLFFVYLAGIAYGWMKKLRPMYMIYLILFYLMTYSSTWLISGGRYTLSALPLFMLGGKWLTEHRKTAPVILAISGAFMIIYLIGFYQWKQIM